MDRAPLHTTNARRRVLISAASGAAALPLAGCATPPSAMPMSMLSPTARAAAVEQVRAAETAFARTMADRDLGAFAGHVADDAVFVNGGSPLRGRLAIVVRQRAVGVPRRPHLSGKMPVEPPRR